MNPVHPKYFVVVVNSQGLCKIYFHVASITVAVNIPPNLDEQKRLQDYPISLLYSNINPLGDIQNFYTQESKTP